MRGGAAVGDVDRHAVTPAARPARCQ
jgi:hypothetical protein